MMRFRALRLWMTAAASTLVLTACGGAASSTPGMVPAEPFGKSGTSPIKHVILVIQENRSFDNLFAHFPGANGAARRGKMKVKEGSKYIDKWQTLERALDRLRYRPSALS